MVSLEFITRTQKEFSEDDFSVVNFWHDKKKQFPNLFAVATRLFASPMASAASDCIFSTLKLFVDEKRSSLSTSIIDDMMVVDAFHE